MKYAVIYVNNDYDFVDDVKFRLFKSKKKAVKFHTKLSDAGYLVFLRGENEDLSLDLPIYEYYTIKYNLNGKEECGEVVKSMNPAPKDNFIELKDGYCHLSVIRVYGTKKECRVKIDKFLEELPPYRVFNNMAILESEIKDGIFEYNNYGVRRIDFNANKEYRQVIDYYLDGVLQEGMVPSGLDYTEVKAWDEIQNPCVSG